MFKGIKEIQHFVGETFDARLKVFDITELPDDKNHLNKWLVDKEKSELEAFKSEEKANQRRATLALIGKELGVLGSIARDEHGKPRIINSNQEISISHCKNLIAYAIAPRPIGVDIHHYTPKTQVVAKKFLLEQEIDFCEKHTEQPFLDLFWGVKEAVFKVYGRNLPFKEIEIDLENIQSNQLTCNVNSRRGVIDVSFALHKHFSICLAELRNS